MTVHDDIAFEARAPDPVRAALLNNAPLPGPLHVVAVVSNPCRYRRRAELAWQFLLRVEAEADCLLYVVELAYGDAPFEVTSAEEPRHLQLRSAEAPIWHKENLVNCGVRALLPPDWRAVAWIDADVEFDDPRWASNALRLLNGAYDVVQLFSHAEDLGADGRPMTIFGGFGCEHARGRRFCGPGRAWHSGFAWACTRSAYERVGGLLDFAVVGSADYYMAAALVGQARLALRRDFAPEYCEAVLDWQRRARHLRLGYVPGVLRHHYHGDKAKRQYKTRPSMLAEHGFAPQQLRRRADGLLEPTGAPPGLKRDIAAYFASRDEDDVYRRAKEKTCPDKK